MIIREDYLIKLNAKNKIQRVLIQLDKNPFQPSYIIRRMTGQYGGKETDQPIIRVEFGKASRTVSEQAGLQYAHILTEYMNSGYKKLASLTKKKYSEMSEDEMKSLLSTGGNTDTKGIPKPMLAKSSDDLSSDIFEKEVAVSRKLDGCRALFYYKDGQILTCSRGGKEYNVATEHLRNDKMLLEIFHKDPDLILDGEIYKHGWPLQKISGLCRLKERNEECDQLEYWIYDIVSNEPFSKRLELLEAMEPLFQDSKIKIVQHKLLSGWLTIKREHDKYVMEGYEGLCARNPNKEYGVGKRSGLYLWKLKSYKDDEFEVTGVKTGLRPEDMCFTLKTKDGKPFSAKPVGDTSTRKYYLEHGEEFIGKWATCKYFNLSTDGIPTQPVLKGFRIEEDLDNK